MRDTAGSAAAPAARCKNCRRGSFIAPSLHFGRRSASRTLRLDVGRPDHLAPLLSLFGDELAEIGGRTRKRDAPKVCEPRLQPGIDEARIDLFVELVNDLDGCVLGNATPYHWLAS